MDFLQLTGKTMLVFGVANRKSVAWHIGDTLAAAGARVVYVVHSAERRETVRKIVGDAPLFVCDVESEAEIARLKSELAAADYRFHGLVHSIARADYSAGPSPFHETAKSAFLRSVDVSCFSLIAICNALKDLLDAERRGRGGFDLNHANGK